MEIPQEVKSFFDADGKLKQWPAKYSKQILIIGMLATYIEEGKQYSEIEINNILNSLHTYRDPVTLRRTMIEQKILSRTPDGKTYWKNSTTAP